MRLMADAEARGWVANVDLDCDGQGNLSWRNGTANARIVGNRVLGPNDIELFVSGAEVTYGRARRRRVQIVDSGVVLLPSRERLYFDESGVVVSARPGRPLRWLPMRMQNFNGDALDQAAMMLMFAVTQGNR